MRVLLDENIDQLLKGLFDPDLQVLTARERGWHGKTNGELLRAAELEFDAFVTMDRKLEFQQNLKALKLSVVILRAPSNAYAAVAPLMSQLNETLRSIKPGTVRHVPA